MSRRWAVFLAVVAGLQWLGVGLAQQPAVPTFRSQINYVELPVRALDSKGSFARGLTQADFQVFEDGQPQTIVDFALVDLPLPVRGATPQAAAIQPAVPPSSPSAALPVEGRMYLLVLDDDRVRPEYSLQFQRIVSGFVRDHMGTGDAAGIVFTSGAKGQDFTADRRLLLAAIDGFIGRYDGDIPRQSALQLGVSSLGAPLDDELRARATLKTIEDVSRAMANVKQRRKAVIYVSATLGCALSGQARPDTPPPIFPVNPLATNPASEGESGRLGQATTLCGETIWTTVRAATQSDVSVYAIDPRGLQSPTWVSPKIDGRGGPDRARDKMEMVNGGSLSTFDGMRVLADSTGGFVVTGTNAFDKALARIVSENSAYYVIGYYSTNSKTDGSVRKNEVRLARKGLKALYRASYMAPRT
jgi:VWFA-related protein